MTLAASLLDLGETAAVLDFFKAYGSFWKMEMGRLAAWTEAVKQGLSINFKSIDWFASEEVS